MRKLKSTLAFFALGLLLLATVQLTAEPGVPSGPPAQRHLFTLLSGDEEVPPVDTNAFGVFTARTNASQTQITFTLITIGLQDIVASHIHIGPAGANGPVTAFLFDAGGEPVTVNGLLSSGTITADDLIGPLEGMTIADLLDEINSGNAYVNVHTTENPGGEIRGQLD